MAETQLTERELAALKVIWDRGGATVHDICAAMAARGADLAYTTVLSLLQVMEQKGLVSHERRGRSYVYRAEIERETTFRDMASGFLDRVFDGAVHEYLVHALDSRNVTKAELEELERMIAEAKRKAREGPAKK